MKNIPKDYFYKFEPKGSSIFGSSFIKKEVHNCCDNKTIVMSLSQIALVFWFALP